MAFLSGPEPVVAIEAQNKNQFI